MDNKNILKIKRVNAKEEKIEKEREWLHVWRQGDCGWWQMEWKKMKRWSESGKSGGWTKYIKLEPSKMGRPMILGQAEPKKLAQKYNRAFLAHAKIGPGRVGPSGFGPTH